MAPEGLYSPFRSRSLSSPRISHFHCYFAYLFFISYNEVISSKNGICYTNYVLYVLYVYSGVEYIGIGS